MLVIDGIHKLVGRKVFDREIESVTEAISSGTPCYHIRLKDIDSKSPNFIRGSYGKELELRLYRKIRPFKGIKGYELFVMGLHSVTYLGIEPNDIKNIDDFLNLSSVCLSKAKQWCIKKQCL